MMMWMVGQGVMVGWMVEGEGWEWAQGGRGGVARGGAGLLIPSDEKNLLIILYQEAVFPIRIGYMRIRIQHFRRMQIQCGSGFW
jgi:hypothetical protein